jgi:glycosyltransferase involved in cell wall biosynthesis
MDPIGDNENVASPNNPLVSINIVTRNRCDALKRALASVYEQTYQPIEVVIVDNDSADESPEMVEERFPEAHLIKLHHNIGCQPGRNIGMKNSRGKYIFNLDDDGWLEKTAIEKIVDCFENDSRIGLIMAAIILPDNTTDLSGEAVEHAKTRVLGSFTGAAHAIRATVLDDAGYFPEYVRGASEGNLSLRMLDKHWELLYLPSAIMHHDLSEIERDKNALAYYQCWHDLENVCRLHPASRVLTTVLWKIFSQGRLSLTNRSVKGYLLGVVQFFYELPNILRERDPVRMWAIQKQNYLINTHVSSMEESINFKKFSTWDLLKARLKR